MNYDDHMRRHNERRIQEQIREAEEESKRLAALEYSCRQAETIVRGTIVPELEQLQAAVKAAGHTCIIKIGKQKFEGIPTEFEAEARVSGNDARLIFAAEPAAHAFAVTLRRTTEDKGIPQMHPYGEITTAAVQHHCAAFLSTAFPA